MPMLPKESNQYITLVSDKVCGTPRKYLPSLLLSHLPVSIFSALSPTKYIFHWNIFWFARFHQVTSLWLFHLPILQIDL